MIEVTDEMRRSAYLDVRIWADRHGHQQPDDRMIDVALVAVLAIVERDYHVRRRPRGYLETRTHAFVRSDDPKFGSAFGGACAHVKDGTTCGYPEPFHPADRGAS